MAYLLDLESPLGWWQLTNTVSHLLSLDWLGDSAPTNPRTQPETRLEQRIHCMLSRYFKGEPVAFDRVPVQLDGTPFQHAILSALRQVPYGVSHSYQWLAAESGHPKAIRAVGGALGRNPLPIIIPCHRIIASGASLGGFMRGAPGGLQLKSALLQLEGIQLAQPKVSTT